MSLIVEDGTGLSTANSYISVADADAYFEARSNSTWDGAIDDSKEAALLYATLWVDRRYVWPGFIVISTQALSWPRGWAYDYEGRVIDSSTVPQAVKDAVCEAALEHLSTSLNEILARGGEIQSAAVGPISVTYSSRARPGRSFPYLDGLLSRLAGPASTGVLTMVAP